MRAGNSIGHKLGTVANGNRIPFSVICEVDNEHSLTMWANEDVSLGIFPHI